MGRTRCSPTSQNEEDDITTFNLIRDSEIEFRMRGGGGVTNKKRRRRRCPTKFATAILEGRQSPPPNSTLIRRRAITICKNCDSQALMAPIYLIRVEWSPFLEGKSKGKRDSNLRKVASVQLRVLFRVTGGVLIGKVGAHSPAGMTWKTQGRLCRPNSFLPQQRSVP